MMQVKLLRVSQEREVQRLGSARSTPVDIRLITVTHRDLRDTDCRWPLSTGSVLPP